MRLTPIHCAVAALCLILSACVNTVPRISSEEEKKIKEELAAQSKIWQQKQQERVEEVASRLLEATGTQTVIRFVFAGNSDQVHSSRINLDAANAWTDGTTVWVTRGMMRFIKNDDELAGILGHEIAHAMRGHIGQGLAQNILGTALAIPAGVFGGDIGQQLAARMVQLATAKFDRDREREADLYGLIWAYRAGFNVDQGKEVFRRIAIEMPGSTERGYLSTHPTPPERFLALDKIAAALKAGQDPIKVFGPQMEEKKNNEEKINEEKKGEETVGAGDISKGSSTER
jgi:predicted Zn-dependent protease